MPFFQKSRGVLQKQPQAGHGAPQAGEGQHLLLSPQVLGFLFFVTAYFLYKSPSASSDALEASLPSQSSASDNPTEQLQSNV